MSYSIDMIEQALKFVRCGGSQVEAGRLFGVDRKTIYNWLKRDFSKSYRKQIRNCIIDKTALMEHVKSHPDFLLRESCLEFGVSPSGMWRSMRSMGLRKKND
jgi:hypothetical protein